MTARPRDGRRAGPARRDASGAPPRGPGGPRAARAKGGWSRAWRPLVLIAAAALAFWVWRASRTQRVAPSDPLAGLDLHVAQDSIQSLTRRGLHAEAMPYLRHIEAALQEPGPDLQEAIATELNNATVQVRSRKGLAIPATRSSVERVAYARESLARFGGLLETGPTLTRRANAGAMRAQLLAVWGFMREGYIEYRRAEEIEHLPDRTRRQAGWVERLLENPTRADIPLMSSGKLPEFDGAMPADSTPRRAAAPTRKR